MAVSVSHELIALFGGSIQTDGMIDVIACGERHFGVVAVNAGGTGIHHVSDVVVATGFENVDEPHDVAVDIGIGGFQTVTHTRLCSQVAHVIELFPFEKRCQLIAVFKIHPHERVARIFCAPYGCVPFFGFAGNSRFGLAGIFEIDVVVIVDVIDTDHFIASFQQPFSKVKADEFGNHPIPRLELKLPTRSVFFFFSRH